MTVNVKSRDVKKALRRTGWEISQSKGDHVTCRKNGVTVNFEGNEEFADWVYEHS